MNLSQQIKQVHDIIHMPEVEEDESMLPGYMKFKHPDGRVDVFTPDGEKVIDGEVVNEKTQSV